jgi:hypothetical protein
LCDFSCYPVIKEHIVCVAPAGSDPLYRKDRPQEEKTCGKEFSLTWAGRLSPLKSSTTSVRAPAQIKVIRRNPKY